MKIKVNPDGTVEIESEEVKPAAGQFVLNVEATKTKATCDKTFEEVLAAHQRGDAIVVCYHTFPGLGRTFVLPLKYIDDLDGKVTEFRFHKVVFENYNTGEILRVMEFFISDGNTVSMSDWSVPVSSTGPWTDNLPPDGGGIV